MTHVLAAGENHNFLLPNATIFVEIVLFLIIFWIFSRYIVPPLAKAMREREEMNHKQAEDREDAHRKLQEAEERYQSLLAEARREATAIRDEARAEAQRIRDEMRTATEQELARIRERGEQQLAEQRQQVLAELRADIGGLSTQLAGRILGKPLSGRGRQRTTIDRFLAELDAEADRPAVVQRSPRGTGGGAS